jgi:eukaryotic-like serine/threonine-protein kinase
MDEGAWEQIKRLFDRVCDLPPEQQRARLQSEGVAPAMIEEVLSLCEADTRSARFIRPVAEALESMNAELPAGTRLGAWQIVSTLAAGGMGRVYLAERRDGQYQQRVAIKLLRNLAGSGDEHYLLRERQILADLQHPNIARLLDGGRSESGEAYLVMEYIEGERIDRWCERRAVDLSSRLRLFQQLCRAVYFAHRHLVLHCDLKPSNILVRGDGTPALLDFGIARLIDPDERAVGAGDNYLTPRYASPEQKAGGALSTASDIYSLGVLLSELLAPPSKAVAASAEIPTHPPSARARRDGVRWARELPGDLDCVVRCATAADPAKRYASAELLAEDINRYFSHRPLIAGPDSWSYRARRLLRRQWPAFVSGAAFVVLVGLFGWRLADERNRALQAESAALREAEVSREVSEFVVSIFKQSDPEAGANPDITARQLLERGREEVGVALVDQPPLQRRMLIVLGAIYDNLGMHAEALELFRRAELIEPGAQTPDEHVLLQDRIAQALLFKNDDAAAESTARAAVAYAEANGLSDKIKGDVLNTLGMVLEGRDRYDEARPILERALALRRASAGRTEVSATLHNLGMVARNEDRLTDADVLLREALALTDAEHGETHPRSLNTLDQLAVVLRNQGHLEEAETIVRRVLAAREKLHGFESTFVANAENEVGSVVHDLGHFKEAITHYQRAIDIEQRLKGPDTTDVIMPLNNLASALDDMGDWAAAEPLFRRSLALRTALYPGDNPPVARALGNLARVLGRLGKSDEARTQWQTGYDMWKRALPEPNSNHLIVTLNGGNLALLRGDVIEAERLLQEARALDATLTEVFPLVRANVHRLDGRVAIAQGRRADAVAAFDRAIGMMTTLFPATHPQLAEVRLERLDAVGAPPARAELDALAAPLEAELVPSHPARRRLAELRTALR